MLTKIEIMRKVDRYIGVVICWLLSIFHCIITAIDFSSKLLIRESIIGSKSKERPPLPRKILFLKPAEMGTSVILYPALVELREIFRDAEVYFLAFKDNIEIMYLLDIIPQENIFTVRIDSPLNFIKDTLGIILKLRRIGIDTVIDLEFFARYTAILGYLIGAEWRVGLFRFHCEGL